MSDIARRTAGASAVELTVIDSTPRSIGSRPRDLWAYRELIYFLAWRDVKVRYKQTIFGAAWAVIQPLILVAVFALFLGRVIEVPGRIVPYPVFVLVGLVPWTLFSRGVIGASDSLITSVNLVTKVYFPRVILAITPALSLLLDTGLSIVVLVGVMAVYGLPIPIAGVALLPILVLAVLVVTWSIGALLAAINVLYRDVPHVVPFLMQVWLFATPVAYPATLAPPRWRWLLGMNPMSTLVDAFRWALLGLPADPQAALLSAGVALVMLVGSILYFRRTERSFADWI